MFVVLGTTTVDLFVSGARQLPASDGDEFTTRSLVFCKAPLQMALGGNGGSAYVLARLGAPVALCSAVGTDRLGDLVCTWLEEVGVDRTALVRSDREATSTTTIITDAEQGRFSFHHPGATPAFGMSDVPDDFFERADVLLVSGYPLLKGWRGAGVRRALTRVHRGGGVTALDIGPAIGAPVPLSELSALLPHVDFLIGNVHELSVLTGTDDLKVMAARGLEAGARHVVIKRGRRGAVIRQANSPAALEVPGLNVEARSTVGAGDTFNAGFLFGVKQGWSLERAARFANAVAAEVVRAGRGVLGSPDLHQVAHLLD